MTQGRVGVCRGCGTARIAMRGVDCCFACWPGGPVTPPPCVRCGSIAEYFTGGRCAVCHPQGSPAPGSCRDCHAWGASRKNGWLCAGCKQARTRWKPGPCPSCRRILPLGRFGCCRLCQRQASRMAGPYGQLDIIGANRHGQQLFLADTFQDNSAVGRTSHRVDPPPPFVPAQVPGQLVLFRARHDLAAHGRPGLVERADPRAYAALAPYLDDLARTHGWSPRLIKDTDIGLRIILGIADDPYGPIHSTDVSQLRGIDLTEWSVRAVLAAADRLIEDRVPALDNWYAQQTAGLPDKIRRELATWFDVMKNGATTPPRRRPRDPITITLHLRWALPTMRAWAVAGTTSLREVTPQQIADALPPSGNPRSTTSQGLRSIFRLLKQRKVVFTDPTRGIDPGAHQPRQPLPANLSLIRAALNSPDPATAAIVALFAFHGLRKGHVRGLQATDYRDGKLHVNGRTVPLAQPVKDRLSAYLTYRNTTWPATANPHLFLTSRSAPGTNQAGERWVKLKIGPPLTATMIREDRILHETNATAGDVKAMNQLFGLSVNALSRYTATLDHPDLMQRPPTRATT